MGSVRVMQEQPCEQFGPDRCREIEDLIEAATGRPCPGRAGGRCPLAPDAGGGGDAVHLKAVV